MGKSRDGVCETYRSIIYLVGIPQGENKQAGAEAVLRDIWWDRDGQLKTKILNSKITMNIVL